MKTQYHLAVVLDSSEACRIYNAATGEQAPLPPAGANTVEVRFRVADSAGVERAALLVVQTDWAQSPDEASRGEETDGASVVVATDAPAEEGAAVLDEWAEQMLHPARAFARKGGLAKSERKAEASRRNILKAIEMGLVGRKASTPGGVIRTRLRRALEEVYGRPLPKDDAILKLMHGNSTPKRRAGAWSAIRESVPEEKRAGIEAILAELDALDGGNAEC